MSERTAFNRSSNSPRNLVPATRRPRSIAMTFRFRRVSGTSPRTIRCASPSTIAVFPTPGSPMSTGLFLVRRARTWITRRISSSRPITGSSLPSDASAVRSVPYKRRASYLVSGLSSITRLPPRNDVSTSSTRSRVTPHRTSTVGAIPERSSLRIANRKCSVLTNWSESRFASRYPF